MNYKIYVIALIASIACAMHTTPPTDQELKETIQRDFPEIIFKRSNRATGKELEAVWPVSDTIVPLNRFLLGILYNIIIDKDPNKRKTAHVRFFGETPSISKKEQDFWKKRDLRAKNKLEEVLAQSIETKKTPRIALISSGGGFRAMISLAGFVNKINELDLLDTIHMIGGVSGSTWLIYPWMASKQPFSKFYPEFVQRVLTGILKADPTESIQNIATFSGSIAESFLRRLAFHEMPTTIDVYGLLLGLHLFDTKTKQKYPFTTLSSIAPHVASGTVPLPVGTAIVQHNDRASDEVEFNPFEVINYGLKSGCPSFGFGRDFYNGKSMSKHPAQTAGYIMGICGSAFSQKVKNYLPTIKDFLKPSTFFLPIFDLIEKTPIGDSRLFPAYIRNYTRGMNASPDKNSRFHAHIDAGLDYDAPMLPTLNPARNIDIIILVESGSNVNWSGSLTILQKVAQERGYPFPHIDYEHARTHPYSIFDDGPDSAAPTIIYVPLVKNPNYSEEFDPWPLIYPYQNNFLHMMNFWYTQEQYDLLAGLFSTAAEELCPDLIESIKNSINKKDQGIRPLNTYGETV